MEEKWNKAPLFIRGVKNLNHLLSSPVDSAQIKSAMILAALRANGISKYKENRLTRDHTEKNAKKVWGNFGKYDSDGFINIHPLAGHLKQLPYYSSSSPSSYIFLCSLQLQLPNAEY